MLLPGSSAAERRVPMAAALSRQCFVLVAVAKDDQCLVCEASCMEFGQFVSGGIEVDGLSQASDFLLAAFREQGELTGIDREHVASRGYINSSWFDSGATLKSPNFRRSQSGSPKGPNPSRR